MATNRPKYLYVTLDALFRVKDIEKYSVSVYFEPSGIEIRKEHCNLLAGFPLYSLTFHQKQLGLLYQILYAFDDIFKRGYDEALFLASDHLILSSSLQYLESIPRDAFFYLLRKYDHESDVPYAVGAGMGGMLLTKECFYWLKTLIEAKTYRGLEWRGHGKAIYEWQTKDYIPEIFAVDGILDAISHFYKLIRCIPPISYLAHFGIRRMFMDKSYEKIINYMEAKFFYGEKHEWLYNVADVLRNGKYPKEIDSGLFPKYFDYK